MTTVAITGITGNMGQATFEAMASADGVGKLKLLSHNAKRTKKLLKKHKHFSREIEIIEGSLTDKNAIASLIKDADIVIALAAVIPPRADKNPKAAIACNQLGTEVLVQAIESMDTQPALVYISTVALYGNRSGAHPFARVGDPLLVSRSTYTPQQSFAASLQYSKAI